MTYIDLINDDKFNYLVEKYMNSENAGIDYKEYFKHFIDNMNKSEILIPVLGIQGAGKSSFLNSILMNENVLPTDVDETTCVPVEVRFGSDVSRAEVYFKGKDKEEINVRDLEKYVHNDYNPANEMGVSKIVIFNDSEILRNNITLVDLPGVGSLTPENQKTTLDYVNKLVAGIFMIRTNPPITRTEKNFINALWPKLSNTIFVQNKWNDETDEDAEDAKEHNEGVLNSISVSHNDNREVNVNIVNVYEAVKGKYTNDSVLYEQSGIKKVISEIEDVSKKYSYNLNETLKIKIEETLKNLEDRINNFIKASINERKENEIEKEKKISEIKQLLSHNKNYFREIRSYASDEMEKVIEEASNIIKENIENLSYNIKSVINRGIVDGEMLSSIYKECSDKAVNNIMDEILGITGELINNLNAKLDCVTIKGFDGSYENISFFNKESSFKFEKSIPSILGLGTGIVGAAGTVGTLGGPLGILVGMGIGLVFSVIGDSIRKEILSTRAKYTIKDIQPMIEKLEDYLREKILDDLRAKSEEVDTSIKELRKKIENTFKEDIESISNQYDAEYDEKHTIEFEKDLDLLKNLRSMI